MVRASKILKILLVLLGAISVILPLGERLAWDRNFRSVLLIFDGEGYTKLSKMGIPVRIPEDSAIGVNEVTLRFLKEAGYAYPLVSGVGSFRRLEIVFPWKLLLLDEGLGVSGEESSGETVNLAEVIPRLLEYRIRKSLSYQLPGGFEVKSAMVRNTALMHLRLPVIPEESENALSLGFYLRPEVAYPSRYGFILRPNGNGLFDSAGVKEKLSFIPKTSKNLAITVFSGDKVLGFPGELGATAKYLEGSIGVPEFTKVGGVKELVSTVKSERVLWLHSIPPDEMAEMSVEDIILRFLRALKERNPRLLYIHPILKGEGFEVAGTLGESLLQANERLISELRARIRDELGYTFSTQIRNPSSSASQFLKPLSLFLGYLFIVWLVLLAFPGSPAGRTLWSLPMQGFFLAFFFLSALNRSLLSGLTIALSLLVAISAPGVGVICAINYYRNYQRNPAAEKQSAREIGTPPKRLSRRLLLDRLGYPVFRCLTAFGIILLICIGAGLLIYAIYHGVEVFTRTQAFRGVILSRLLPTLLVLIYCYNLKTIGGTPQQRDFYLRTRRLFSYPISYGDLALLLILLWGLALVFMRAGNEFGFLVSAQEATVRSTLENLFGVRPRNLEIIGHAGLLLFLFLLPRFHKTSLLLLAVGVLGMSTVINTFSHFHTPLLVSFLRVSIGVLLGVILFLVIWLVYNIGRMLVTGSYYLYKRVS